MAPTSKVRIGFIGCGGIHWAHHHGLLEIPDKAQIVACCDSYRENAERSAAHVPTGAKVYTDWKELLAQPDVDAVDICLPHHLHKDAIIDAANAGKHILCEKPLCLTLEEADQIMAAVKKSGVIYMSAHNQVFSPIIETIKTMIREGAVGDVYTISTADCFLAAGFAAARENMGWRGDVAKQGGGELIDTGYHPSYLLLYLADSPFVDVKAFTSTFRLPMDAEDTAWVLVRFANGVLGQILTSWAMPRPAGMHQVHVMGSQAQLYGSNDELFYWPHGFNEPARRKIAGKGGIAAEVEHFVDCVRANQQPRTTLQQGRDVLELILKATADAKRA